MKFEIAARKPTEEELKFVDKLLVEFKRTLANLYNLKIQVKENGTDLTEEIKSVQEYLSSQFNFIINQTLH